METQLLWETYWADFHDVLNNAVGPVVVNRKPQRQNWMTYAVFGRSGFSLGAAFNTRENHIRAWLDINGGSHGGRESKAFLDFLKREDETAPSSSFAALKGTIEEELKSGSRPNITEKEAKIVRLKNVNSKDRSDWPEQHKWLANRLNRMHEVFALRVKQLNLND